MPSTRSERDRVSTMVGQWRAMYTPGDWVLLSGPTSLVFLEPPGPEHSSMINTLWEEVVASSSMSDLAARLATFPIDTMPSFAAFFWTGDGMRSLVRGSVSVIDLASGVTVAQGEGIQTWSEVGLQQISQVQVETGSSEETRRELPLVVGAVLASPVRLDASPEARVSSPQRAIEPDAAPAYANAGGGVTRREAAVAEPLGGERGIAAYVGGAARRCRCPRPARVGRGAGAAPVGGLPDSSAPEAGSSLGPSFGSLSRWPRPYSLRARGRPARGPSRRRLSRRPMAYGDASDPGPQTELLANPFADDDPRRWWRPPNPRRNRDPPIPRRPAGSRPRLSWRTPTPP